VARVNPLAHAPPALALPCGAPAPCTAIVRSFRCRTPRLLGSMQCMKLRIMNLLLLLLAPIIVAGATVLDLSHRPASSRIYTVTAVVAGLYSNPQAWLGRTIRLRGIVRSCGASWSCHGATPYLADGSVETTDWAHQLQVVPAPPDRNLTFWRRFPGFGALLPQPQQLKGTIPTVYRVLLTADMCGVCFEGIVQDAAP